ncbi:hemin uptake protein HemP [Stappia sp.]|uniref:hemin uptake protein HemP n=1 Tax=Stappia sp. TaxID=1870903 RepID=UPI0032D96C83
MSEASFSRPVRSPRRPAGRPRLHLPKDATRAAEPEPLELDSTALFQGAREVLIRHKDSVYRLSITRFEKLLLTK